MGNWITNHLKQIETQKHESHVAQPFKLVGQDGTPFTAYSLSKGFFLAPRFLQSPQSMKRIIVPC